MSSPEEEKVPKEEIDPSAEEVRTVEIFFGAIHTYSRDPSKKYVIVDVGEDNWFTVAQIMPNGRIVNAGTSHMRNIRSIVGSMTLLEIIVGMEMTFESGLTQTMLDELRISSTKPPRTLTG